ncbi:hypothetical protein [Capnocytophaga felis]|uniref:DUF4595 domain-containing protein n=1 Tax=Capnocytophaga felis TaxID=2267611 RepID=A0A5M4B956_9FLAO|nr:hypothetical protein [Capnocytophaga felis]GET46144.1 hypothetical protein RCZ01_14460 [Capnocytophaga felis]GET48937.1 hypothetical protein RCZ02_17680 [Capnocytophaga felis]
MKRCILSLFALSLIVSCSKDNTDGGQPIEETVVLPKKVVEHYTRINRENGVESEIPYVQEENYEIVNNKVLSATFNLFENKVQIASSKFTTTYENNLPKTSTTIDLLKKKEKETSTLKYANGKLIEEVQEQQTDNAKIVNTTLYKYSGDKLVEIQNTRSDSGLKLPQKITFTYPSATEIKKVEASSYISGDKEIPQTNTTTYTLDAEKRVVKSVEESDDSTIVEEYQYDNKNNYRLRPITFVVHPDYFINEKFMKNNLLSKKRTYTDKQNSQHNETETTTYTYQYNDKDYPTRIEEVYKSSRETNSKTKTTEITY